MWWKGLHTLGSRRSGGVLTGGQGLRPRVAQRLGCTPAPGVQGESGASQDASGLPEETGPVAARRSSWTRRRHPVLGVMAFVGSVGQWPLLWQTHGTLRDEHPNAFSSHSSHHKKSLHRN